MLEHREKNEKNTMVKIPFTIIDQIRQDITTFLSKHAKHPHIIMGEPIYEAIRHKILEDLRDSRTGRTYQNDCGLPIDGYLGARGMTIISIEVYDWWEHYDLVLIKEK